MPKYRIKVEIQHDGTTFYTPQTRILWGWWVSLRSSMSESDARDRIARLKEKSGRSTFTYINVKD